LKKLKDILVLAGYTPAALVKLVLIGIAGGLASFAFIAMVNQVLQGMINPAAESQRALFTLYFSLTIVLFFFSKRILSIGIIRLSQTIFWTVRKEIIRIALHSPYKELNDSRNDVLAVLTTDVDNITAASFSIIELIISAILIISCILYMFFLSPILSGISLVVIFFGAGLYHITGGKLDKLFSRTRELEVTFIRYFNAILSGAKEINIEPKKGREIYENKLMKAAEEGQTNNTKAFVGFMNNEMIGQVLFYVLITFIVLFSGYIFTIKNEIVISFVLVLLYILGPIEIIMGLLPVLSKASISSAKILELKAKLEASAQMEPLDVSNISLPFKEIKVDQLRYQFSAEKNLFEIGPLDFTLKNAEVYFIYGGNGSGKTTFLFTLLSLYNTYTGQILVDGVPVSSANESSYKKLFAPVFSDFHLFDAFYGIDQIDEIKLRNYLELFEIDHKVKIENKMFSTTNLSTGQKKRLALISVLMENKPILVLDEWAADQDPGFRKKFYLEIIPALKKSGLTILAITHDDNYYHCADRLFKMDAGQLTEQLISKADKNRYVY
jgi:putative ATP-binding cassette transporter